MRYIGAAGILLGLSLAMCSCSKQSTPSQNLVSQNQTPAQSLITHEAYKSPADLLAQDIAEQRQNIALRKLIRGDTKRRWIALTFDDGPHPNYTPKIVAILRQHNVRATFFVVGKMAEKYPNLVRLLQASGMEIGNHTYDHVNLTKLNEGAIAAEIERCGEVIRRITGSQPTLFRPPGGDYNPTVARVAERLGYWMVLWTDDPGDYAQPPESVLRRRLFTNISNGGVILLHDGVSETVNLLPQLIENLHKEGYEIVPVGEMIPKPPTP